MPSLFTFSFLPFFFAKTSLATIIPGNNKNISNPALDRALIKKFLFFRRKGVEKPIESLISPRLFPSQNLRLTKQDISTEPPLKQRINSLLFLRITLDKTDNISAKRLKSPSGITDISTISLKVFALRFS